MGACHVVVGLYDTDDKDKIVVPKLDDDYLVEYKKLLEESKEKFKLHKRKKIVDENKSLSLKGRKEKGAKIGKSRSRSKSKDKII